MTDLSPLPFTAPLGAYLDQAQTLLAALHAGDEATAWRFKWEHPRFRDAQVGEVRTAVLDVEDAKLVTARSYAFEGWADLAAFAERAALDRGIVRFESAADAIVAGDRDVLEALLREDPALAGARSARRHRATHARN